MTDWRAVALCGLALLEACAAPVPPLAVEEIPVHSSSAVVRPVGSYPRITGTDSAFNKAIEDTVLHALAAHLEQAEDYLRARRATASGKDTVDLTRDSTAFQFTVTDSITRNDADY